MPTFGGSYDDKSFVIDVDYVTIEHITDNIKNTVNDLVDRYNRIGDATSKLQLNWFGNSSAEFEDFRQRWTLNCTHLFGTKDNSVQGVISKFVSAVETAGSNYGYAEDGVYKLFQQMNDGLTNPKALPPPKPGSLDLPPIKEDW